MDTPDEMRRDWFERAEQYGHEEKRGFCDYILRRFGLYVEPGSQEFEGYWNTFKNDWIEDAIDRIKR